ncbi:MAG: DMT family transporter, partial [Clostridia bacterium]|nr:DMT family transporter [Clostridia bacterium]
FSFHILAIDYFSPKVDGVKLSCVQFFISGAINIVLMLVLEKPQVSVILQCYTAILYSGIMSCGVAYTLQIVGQKYTDPASASILMSLESVFAVLAGTVLLQERMTVWEILGCVLMFAAILLVQLPEDMLQKVKK